MDAVTNPMDDVQPVRSTAHKIHQHLLLQPVGYRCTAHSICCGVLGHPVDDQEAYSNVSGFLSKATRNGMLEIIGTVKVPERRTRILAYELIDKAVVKPGSTRGKKKVVRNRIRHADVPKLDEVDGVTLAPGDQVMVVGQPVETPVPENIKDMIDRWYDPAEDAAEQARARAEIAAFPGEAPQVDPIYAALSRADRAMHEAWKLVDERLLDKGPIDLTQVPREQLLAELNRRMGG